MDADLFAEQMLRRLDTLIAVMLDVTPTQGRVPVASKIQRLAGIGLAPAEIASILGKPTNYVTASLATKRKPTAKRAR